MAKPSYARDIRSGDVLWHHRFGQFTAELVIVNEKSVIITDSLGQTHSVVPGEFFVIIARPWQEGKTEETMKADLEAAARSLAKSLEYDEMPYLQVAAREALREVLDAYELGL